MALDPHIIHVVPNESGGGAEHIVCDLQSGLTDLGLYCERVHFCGEFLDGPPVTRFGLSHASLRNIPRLRRLLKARLSAGRSRIILHSHLTHGFYVSLLAAAGLPVKWVHTEHNTTMRLREVRLVRPIERRLYQRCDRVVAISNGVRHALETVLRLPSDKIALLRNGARDFGLARRPAVAHRQVQLISIGSLNERKGFDIAFRALARAKIGPWHYTIVGEGPERASLELLAANLGIVERVTFVGWADPGDFYHRADLQLIPSRWEGFGLVAVEGMSTGLRVVASDVDGVREVVGPDPHVGWLVNGHLSPENWVGPLETAVVALRAGKDPSSHASVQLAQLFTIKRMTDEHVALYRSL